MSRNENFSRSRQVQSLQIMSKPHPILRFCLWILLLCISSASIIFIGALLYLSPKLPPVEEILEIPLQTPLRVYTQEHKLISEFGEQKRSPITFEQIPEKFTQAIISAEDNRFYSHPGVDLKGLMRAFFELVTTGSIKSGGSTITMQVAKNYFLSRERTFLRKFNEILLALDIERELPKNKILELYINKIYLGHRSYGIAAASKVYYGKPIDQLSVAQLAMIAGLPKAPSSYNPVTNPERALKRRDWILSRMKSLNYLTQEEYLDASQQPVTAKLHTVQTETHAPYLAEMVRKELLSRYGKNAYTDGYRVFTSIKHDYQQAANQAIHNGLISYDQRHGYRGPEGTITLDAPDNSLDMTHLQKALNHYQTIGSLLPGVVLKAEDQNATILLKNQRQITLSWEQSQWARPHISTNQMGQKPKMFTDILSQGDVIRVQLTTDGEWKLSQLPIAQSALVSMSPEDGSIMALVGGFNYQSSKFNRAIQAGRQAGSNIKPFIYSAALANGMTAATIINDSPLIFKDKKLESTWRPENSGGTFGGLTRLREALYRSKNLVSIRLLKKTGIRRTINYMQRYGFDKEKLPTNLSLALGVAELTPLEIATGYATLANNGYKISPWFIERIEDSDGNILFEANPEVVCSECSLEDTRTPPINEVADIEESAFLEDILQPEETPSTVLRQAEQVVEPRITYLINSMLKDVIKRGTGRRARALNRSDIGGKTGTTNDQKDAWFSGFNPNVVTTVWVGFDTPKTLGRREYGGTAALPIWIDYMKVALQDYPDKQSTQPEGLITVKIDPETGKRASAGQPSAIFEIFREEYAPRDEAENTTLNPYTEDNLYPEQLF